METQKTPEATTEETWDDIVKPTPECDAAVARLADPVLQAECRAAREEWHKDDEVVTF